MLCTAAHHFYPPHRRDENGKPLAELFTPSLQVSVSLSLVDESGASKLLGGSFKCIYPNADQRPHEPATFEAADGAVEASALVSIPLNAGRALELARGGMDVQCADTSGNGLFSLHVDLTALYCGEGAVQASFSSNAGSLPGDAQPHISRASVKVAVSGSSPASPAFLSAELLAAVCPMTFTLLRLEHLPGDYSGREGAPFEELRKECSPVHVAFTVPVEGSRVAFSPKPHAESIVWKESHTVFVGPGFRVDDFVRSLVKEPLVVEVRDRDAAHADEAALQKGPHGVASFNLAAMVAMAEGVDHPGLRTFASRRLTFSVPVVPCSRPSQRVPQYSPEPPFYLADEPPFYPGKYVEAGTCLTLKVESHAPLREAQPSSQMGVFQRAVAVLRYADTAFLDEVLGLIAGANDGNPVARVSAWAEATADESADVISGVQCTDGFIRCFLLEGPAARFAAGSDLHADAPMPLNAMARLAVLLKRRADRQMAGDEPMPARILSNWEATFRQRLYVCFEAPMALIRLREPLAKMAVDPRMYMHGRLSPACYDALTKLQALVGLDRLRTVEVRGLWPRGHDLQEVDKKLGDVLTLADRKGVRPPQPQAEVPAPARDAGEGPREEGAGRGRERRRPEELITDSSPPRSFVAALRRRRSEPGPDHVARNRQPLPCPNPCRKPRTFEFAPADLAGPDGQVYPYSTQRHASTEKHKALLQTACEEEAERTGFLRSYNPEFLDASFPGDVSQKEHKVRCVAGRPPGADRVAEAMRPPAQAPVALEWEDTKPIIYLWDQRTFQKTGEGWVKSRWQIPQPDRARLEELQQPWRENAHKVRAVPAWGARRRIPRLTGLGRPCAAPAAQAHRGGGRQARLCHARRDAGLFHEGPGLFQVHLHRLGRRRGHRRGGQGPRAVRGCAVA